MHAHPVWYIHTQRFDSAGAATAQLKHVIASLLFWSPQTVSSSASSATSTSGAQHQQAGTTYCNMLLVLPSS
jgi:hypothetical protein